jgi:glycosyltransferase involved in cell wall biosynthesis
VRFSIVVPAFNEEALLPRTLAAIKAAAGVLGSWELIVCDNNSTDRTTEVAREAGARVVFEAKNQISRARNAGAAAATGGWLIFVDADSWPSRELFAHVRDTVEASNCIGGGATLRIESTDASLRFITGGWNLLSRAARWAAGSFVFCEAAAFREVGGFSEELYASEELDLSRKLKRLGRERGKRFVILHRHPLVTSARKAHLYHWRDHLAFLRKFMIHPGKTVRNPGACHTWYDGRR